VASVPASFGALCRHHADHADLADVPGHNRARSDQLMVGVGTSRTADRRAPVTPPEASARSGHHHRDATTGRRARGNAEDRQQPHHGATYDCGDAHPDAARPAARGGNAAAPDKSRSRPPGRALSVAHFRHVQGTAQEKAPSTSRPHIAKPVVRRQLAERQDCRWGSVLTTTSCSTFLSVTRKLTPGCIR